MTDPQLANNNSSSSSNNNHNNNNNSTNANNNNDGEPKYLHKKFKKMATTEMAAPTEAIKKEIPVIAEATGPPETAKRRDIVKDVAKDTKESSRATETSPESEVEARKTGYVCPYCKLSCAKPSVLQKHIRAHTNERPYPCVPCGFAFKTKSNLYKHCRSRAHALKMEGGSDAGKVSEDSDISLSDSASNGTGTPPPLPASSTPSSVLVSTKTVKTGKIYKPKFHTALQCVNNDTETSSSTASNLSSNGSTSTVTTTISKPNVEQLQEHIDKIITDNQAIVDAVDPRLHKLIQRQQSLVVEKSCEQPLNLSSAEEISSRKRCYSESFTQEKGSGRPQNAEGSIIKDLLLKSRGSNSSESTDENFICPSCKIPFTSPDNLEAHRRYYCKGSSPSPKRDFQLDLEKRDEFDSKLTDHYSTVQPLPSPGPLLGNTRLVDAYPPPTKKQRSESVPTTLRSLEELSKYPRPNSLQMFGGEVRILDNSGETKTMRIEPRQTNSPSSDHTMNNKCATSETSSIVVRSGLHSGGTMVHKPPGPPASTPSSSISLPNTPKMLAPIIPNISTPNLAPTMSCYSYLESHLNPLSSITAYNPLTLPQAGIASILHGGKVIPYVPGMPGPHTLSGTASVDISPVQPTGNSGYKVIPGIPGLHVIPQPLDLANPVKVPTPSIPGMPGPTSNAEMITSLGQPLNLAGPGKEPKHGFKHVNNGHASPKVPAKLEEKYRSRSSSTPSNEFPKADDRHIKAQPKYKNLESPRRDLFDKSPKVEKVFNYPNVIERMSSKIMENRKRPANWGDMDGRSFVDTARESPLVKYGSPPPPQENGRLKMSPDASSSESYGSLNGTRLCPENIPPVIVMNSESPKLECISSAGLASSDKSEINSLDNIENEETNTKFLRPTSLPLKPGTFTPKRHHGITPTANTLPLISPETPRPKKSYGQLYLNGHAYTYLGLKCSTRVFYCTLNRPQPMYVTQQHGLSMYSNWKICKEAPPDLDMAHYDSRHRSASYTVAWKRQADILTHSSQRPTTPTSPDSGLESDMQEKIRRVKIFDGGFESNEDYTYVRGRGRGRYVCEECGIRCKKPSMLKKHIRTHTDVRPYTCKHCSFSFKTKGNLTKHMKSKAHYKKCVELGVTPVPTTVCDENIDKEAIAKLVAGGGNAEDSSEEEEETDGDESEESGSEEHEAAQSLLSLSQPSPNRLPGLVSSGRPSTYPYALTFPVTSVTTSIVATVASTAAMSVTSSTTVIQSEVSHRYYFPSSRAVSEDCRDSVIRSSKTDDDDDVEMEHIHEASRLHQSSQPMDLTTKTPQTALPLPLSSIQRPMPADILTPVSGPVLIQTIVQTMERLPPQGREWKPEAEGHMLQAYLTERHVMDSKMKQQYRVGPCKFEKKQVVYSKVDFVGSRNALSGSTPTVTYTDPSKMQQMVLEARGKKEDDVKLEIRNERRPFDIESLHPERETGDLRLSSLTGVKSIDHTSVINKRPQERSGYILDMVNRELPKSLMKNELGIGGRESAPDIGLQERQDSILNTRNQSPRPPSRDTRTYDRSPSHELSVPSEELKLADEELKDRSVHVDRISPNRDTRVEYKSEHRVQRFDIQSMELPKIPEIPRAVNRELRNSERQDVKINIEITKQQSITENIKYGVARKMVVGGPGFRSPSPPGRNPKPHAEFLQPSSGPASNYVSVSEDGRSVCGICNKVFSKPSQLRLHINIHYFERPFRCESCAVSFRTKGHLTKHERSVSHHNKVSLTSTFGAATTSNPRPFKCTDCKSAFRIHGHLAKHLRSKMHIMKLECLGKLPFGTYAEMERSGVNLNDIDTTDCDNSLTSLQVLAQKLYEKDPSKMGQWDTEMVPPHHQGTSGGETSSDEGEPIPPNSMHQFPSQLTPDMEVSRAYHMPALINSNDSKVDVESHVPNSRFEDNSLPYKCQMCARSLRTVNELQVHCFVEHNVEGRGGTDRGKENAQKRVSERIVTVCEDQGRQKNNDT